MLTRCLAEVLLCCRVLHMRYIRTQLRTALLCSVWPRSMHVAVVKGEDARANPVQAIIMPVREVFHIRAIASVQCTRQPDVPYS